MKAPWSRTCRRGFADDGSAVARRTGSPDVIGPPRRSSDYSQVPPAENSVGHLLAPIFVPLDELLVSMAVSGVLKLHSKPVSLLAALLPNLFPVELVKIPIRPL